jgi:pSer/pThr/pTyr-binding forkhead associated (FHA) protein
MTRAPAILAATNYQALIRPLQWFVVILIFLFFLRVIRAVWVETRPGGRRKERRGGGGRRAMTLEVLEPAARAGERFTGQAGRELTIGRSLMCDIPIAEDVYASTVHAKVTSDGTTLSIEDLHSTNGTYVNTERVVVPVKLSRGDLVQIGGTIFEVTR